METNPALPVAVFEAIVTSFAETLIASYRQMSERSFHPAVGPTRELTPARAESVWLTVSEAAKRARCGRRVIYHEVQAGRLRAAKIGGRRTLRVHENWVDEWLERAARR